MVRYKEWKKVTNCPSKITPSFFGRAPAYLFCQFSCHSQDFELAAKRFHCLTGRGCMTGTRDKTCPHFPPLRKVTLRRISLFSSCNTGICFWMRTAFFVDKCWQFFWAKICQKYRKSRISMKKWRACLFRNLVAKLMSCKERMRYSTSVLNKG